jgi:hypothetical protein
VVIAVGVWGAVALAFFLAEGFWGVLARVRRASQRLPSGTVSVFRDPSEQLALSLDSLLEPLEGLSGPGLASDSAVAALGGRRGRMSRVEARSIAVLLATGVAGVSYITDWKSPSRVAITLMFLLFLPGLAVSDIARVRDGLLRLVVAIGASLALETLVAVTLLYAGLFTPGRAFAAIVCLTAAAATVAALTVRGEKT